MTYTIRIDYTTGDSFGCSEETDDVGCVWENKELARKSLADIKEHYQYYKEKNDYWNAYGKRKTEKELLKEIKDKSWYSKDYWEHCILLDKDDNTQQLVSCFWTGYFERLNVAEVVTLEEENSEDKVTF